MESQRQDVTLNRVSPGYFQTMETPLLVGRDFNQTDTSASPRTAIVNGAFARKLYGGANPVGRVFHDSGAPDKTYQVVGMVKDSKFYDLREDPVPSVYVSFTQANGPEQHSTLMIRSDEPLLPLISAIDHAANEINPSIHGAQLHGVQDADSRRSSARKIDGHAVGFLWRAGDDAGRNRPRRRHLVHRHSTQK